MPSFHINPFLLAADNSPELLPALFADPSLATSQDDHGYSLVHAAASYNHLDLLRTLVQELNVPVDLRDEDGETALFACETVECARVLIEELHANPNIKGDEGKTAGEKIEIEGDFPEVSKYILQQPDVSVHGTASAGTLSELDILNRPPPLPEGMTIELGTIAPEDIGEDVFDSDFKQRIDDLAARGDFQGEEGQRRLRELVTDAVRDQVGQERDVQRRRT